MQRISLTITEQNKAKLDNYVKNWAIGEYKDNTSAFINHLIERYVASDPS